MSDMYSETFKKPIHAAERTACITAHRDIMMAFSIFDPRKIRNMNSDDLYCYGENSVGIFFANYRTQNYAKTIQVF